MMKSLNIKRAIAISLATVCLAVSSWAIERSTNVVYVNGNRFYIHKVAKGETLYSISKFYDIEPKEVISNNKTSIHDKKLRVGSNIKIPFTGTQDAPSAKMSNRERRRTYDTHTISRGETLYSIARKYEISVSTIMEDNPNLDPSRLPAGQKLMIRKDQKGNTDHEQTISELADYTNNLNKVAPKGYKYHVVAKGDTLYSLLRKNDMSRDEFDQINDIDGDHLNVGSVITLRDNEAQMKALAEQEAKERRERESKELHFVSLDADEELTISLLLPLTSSGRVSPVFAEFYQGFLMGLKELKDKRYNITLNLFDTQKSSAKINSIINDSKFQESDLIVGPVYENLMPAVVEFAQERSIPVVSPLATINKINSGVLFQMAPTSSSRYDKIGELLDKSRQVTFISTKNVDSEYEASLKSLLGGRGYINREFVYEHPSVINDRAINAKKYNRQPVQSKGDLSDIIGNDDVEHTIFITANNETDVDRILSAIASAEVALRGKSQRVAKYRVVGNSKWNQYSNIDRAMLFKDNVIFFSSYHAKSDNSVVKSFDNSYIKAFGKLPSLYSYRGYDVAKIFGEGMYSDIEYGMKGRTFTPLQTQYRFDSGEDSNVRANQNWVKVNYNQDFTITLE